MPYSAGYNWNQSYGGFYGNYDNYDDCCDEYEKGTRRSKCFACGNGQCKSCSTIVLDRENKNRRIRVCAQCLEDDGQDFGTIRFRSTDPWERDY